MIGIYKITNKINGKMYIGQSNDIQRRFDEHCRRDKMPIDIAIQKYGMNNFTFEVIEECSLEELSQKEIYWIAYYDSMNKGYNCTPGGELHSLGENNGNAILSNEDIIIIRTAYREHRRRRAVYEQFKDRISFDTFANIWDGSTWKHIMPEVYTPEDITFYSKKATNGELSDKALFTNEEVIEMRKRYVNENARSIYKDYKDRCAYQTLQQILWGKIIKIYQFTRKKKRNGLIYETCIDYPRLEEY